MNKLVFVLISLLLFCAQAARADSALPKGCEHVGYDFSDPFLVLNPTGKQTFYLIENITDDEVELQKYETEDVFMSPPLIAELGAKRWAAFASDVQALHFQCFVHQEYDIIRTNCRDVINICQYPRVKFALSNMGNYWVSKNKSQKRVIQEAIAKGILLRW